MATERVRVQFDFAPEALARLDAMREVTEARNRAQVIRLALRAYEWFVQTVRPEMTIQMVESDDGVSSGFKGMLLLAQMGKQANPLATLLPKAFQSLIATQKKGIYVPVQFYFSADALARVDVLKEATGVATRADVVREALRLYEWLVNEVKPGMIVKVLDTTGTVVSSFDANLLMHESGK